MNKRPRPREVFKLGEGDLDDDAVFVAWRLLDPDGTGKAGPPSF
jgi:hypothetical protein